MGGDSKWRRMYTLKVNFPLLKGKLGWRGMVIHKNQEELISGFRTVDDFNKHQLIACQGLNWPDTTYLKNAGFNVVEVTHFDSMMKMLETKRCDFVPLSIFEGQAEVEAISHRYSNLTFIYQPIIRYKLNMYFFVNTHKPMLAERISKGLSILQASGKFDLFIHQALLTKNAFPLNRFKHFIDVKTPNVVH